MANIKVKRSSVAGKVPTITDLALGEIAVNTYDGLAFIKKSVDGVESIVALGGLGGSAGDLQDRSIYIATSGQTTFSAQYSAPYVDVYLNGVLLSPSDYTATNGTSVILGTGAVVGDIVQIIGHKILGVAGTLALSGGTMTGAINFDSSQTWPTFNQNTTGSAATLTTPRTIAITGDVAYTSGAFDGSGNATGVATLSNSGVTAGTYGSDTNIPQLAVDAKGRVTSVTNVAVSIPSGALTFTGDVTGTGSTGTSTALTLAATGTAGTYTKVTTDSKGRVTSGTTLVAADIPGLDASKITSGTIDAARLPSYVDDVVEAATLAGFPATGETGKIYVALDTNKAYRWSGSTYVYITSGAVDSVAGRTGVVTLTSSDVGLGSVDNTSDTAKPVSTAQQTALNLKANLASPTFTGTVAGITAAMVGLGSVDNTSDAAKPVSTAQQTALNLKANLASPTFTGTVAGITAAMVGLGSVDNKSSATIRGEITSSNVTSALGFTPYNATNPSGYITSSASISGNAATSSNAALLNGYASSSSGSADVVLRTASNGYLYLNNWLHPANGTGLFYDAGVHFYEVSNYMYSSTGFTAANDVRAPIFYDNNDTAYYVNPNATTNLYDLQLTGAKQTYLYLNPGNGYEAMVRYNGGSGSGWYVGKRTTSQLVGTESFHFYSEAAGVTVGGIDTSGNIFASTSHRAPIFYDNNDTSYYLDPNGSSLMSSLNVNGNFRANFISGGGGTTFTANHYSIGKDYANGSWSGPHYGDLIIGYHTGIRLGANYSGIRFYADSPTTDANNDGNGDGGEALLMTVGGFAGGSGVLVNNTLTAGVDVRAPIFYDQNNTGYYLDPNSTSSLNVITTNEIYNYGWFRNHESNEGMYNQATGQHWYSDSANYWNMGGGVNGQGIRFRDNHAGTVRGYIYYDQSNNIGFLNQDGSWRLRVIGGDYSQVDGSSMRAPLYYDSDNTAYYVDPAGTSNLNALLVNGVAVASLPSQTGNSGKFLYSNGSTASWEYAAFPPTAPTNVSAGAASLTSITVSYTQGANGTENRIYYSTTSPVTTSSAYVIGGASSGTVTGLNTDTTYYVAVATHSFIATVLGDQVTTATPPAGTAVYTSGQTLEVTSGTASFLAGSGVTSIKIECAGGGGGGGGNWNSGGAAGGTGGVAAGIYDLSAGRLFTYYVGGGGSGGSQYAQSGHGGGASAVVLYNTFTTIVAAGGAGGGGDGWNGTAGTGGAGGTAVNQTGPFIANGANGQTTQSAGGGGGSSVPGTNSANSAANAVGRVGGKGGNQGGSGGGGTSGYGEGGSYSTTYFYAGGGGGGGYFGGAGGWGSSAGDGGGGGSSYLATGISPASASISGGGGAGATGTGGAGRVKITFI